MNKPTGQSSEKARDKLIDQETISIIKNAGYDYIEPALGENPVFSVNADSPAFVVPRRTAEPQKVLPKSVTSDLYPPTFTIEVAVDGKSFENNEAPSIVRERIVRCLNNVKTYLLEEENIDVKNRKKTVVVRSDFGLLADKRNKTQPAGFGWVEISIVVF